MTYRKVFTLAIFLSTACLFGCKQRHADMRTEAVAKLVVRYLNEHKFDSLYRLTDTSLQKRVPRNMSVGYLKKLTRLLPINRIDYITGNDSVSFYNLAAKRTLGCYISLNKAGKLTALAFQPYQEDIKQVSMNADEHTVDVLAHKVLDMLQHKQVDSVYMLAGDGLKSKINPAQWQSIKENILQALPFLPPFFLRNEKGLNVYALGYFRFAFGAIDKTGRFNAFYFWQYRQQAVKPQKVSTDNQMKTQLDGVVDKAVSPYMKTLDNVGLSAVVLYKGNTYFYNYGERKKGQHNLPDKHTLYDIGSITKTFTGTLLAIAVNKKKITLETPIIKYLPDSVGGNPALKNITFKELANHTSGLVRDAPNYKPLVTDIDQPFENYDIRAMFSFLKHFKQTRQPGIRYSYSNIGFGLLGVLLERIYQKTYPELVSQYITTPLKMNETVVGVDSAKFKDLAQGYDALIDPVPFFKLGTITAAGAIKSSTADLMVYAKAQLSATDPTLDAGIKLSHQLTFAKEHLIGLGWEYFPNNKSVLMHGGATGGYRSAIGIDINKQIAIVVLTNNVSYGDQVGWDLIKAIQDINK